MFKKQDPYHLIIWLPIFLILQVSLSISFAQHGETMGALCSLFAGIATGLGALDVILVELTKYRVHPLIKWLFVFIGGILLLGQIGYEDAWEHSAFFNVVYVLVGYFGLFFFNRKKSNRK